MSVYPQVGYGHGHASYPGPSYSQPQPIGYYQPPPPAPYYQQLDPNTFRRDYQNRLAELTVNSRPIIQNLSMVAQEYSRFSEIVAQCLEAHIRRVPPWMKLPAFYLLDAISKNVFDPYARQFSPMVSQLFLDSYREVDQSTRSKMEEMLLTWRTGGANGKELFGVVPQVAIERGVWGGASSHANPTASFHHGPGQISKSQVLSELDFVLGQKERAIQSNPYDKPTRENIGVLHALRNLVEAGVAQEELRHILSQLRSLSQQASPPPPPPMPSQPAAGPSTYSQSYEQQGPHRSQPAFSPSTAYVQAKSEPMDLSALMTLSQSGPIPVSASAPPAAAHMGNIANLFQALVKAGVVPSNTGTPTGAGETAKAEETKPEVADPSRIAAREYRRSILSHKMKLTSAAITKTRPDIVHFLYNRLSVQCKQCGIRFADSTSGKKDMQDHLDMHFRQNRKANQNIGRGHSRSWFIGVEDWTHDIYTDVKGKSAEGHRPLNAKAAAAAEVEKRDADLRALFIVVPPGDEAKPISCPICKETIKSEFLEDDEDWVWKNAILKDDKVFHATCHAEAVTSTNSLAARLRHEVGARSRSGTPEYHSARSTPPKLSSSSSLTLAKHSLSPIAQGTKRKVENEESSTQTEADGSPPMKKLAIAA